MPEDSPKDQSQNGSETADSALSPTWQLPPVDEICRILETDPDTSAQWDAAGIDAAEFGVKVG